MKMARMSRIGSLRRNVRGPGLVLTLACGACVAGPPTDVAPGPVQDPCAISDARHTGSRVSVALLEAVQPGRAPVPRTSAERLLFRHLYQGLVGVTCDGRAEGELAARWEGLDGGRAWRFHLREGVRFWDGTPLTARAVVRAWARGEGATRLASMRAGPVMVQAVGERTVRVVTARPEPRLPWLLAVPELAVVKRGRTGGWPLGTGPFRLVGRGGSAGDLSGTWVAEAVSPPAPPGLSIEFHAAAGMDPRDAMEMRPGADLLLTSDPRAVEFARARPEFRAEPLPWNRVYVLLVPRRREPRGESALSPRTAPTDPGRAFLESLAGDAVRRDARAAQPPYWWDRAGECDPSASSGGPGAPRVDAGVRVAYGAGDETAANLAERLVALLDAPRRSTASDRLARLIWGSSDTGGEVVARGLPPHELIAALRTGSEAAYVVAMPRAVLDVCQSLEDLTSGEGLLAGLDPRLVPVILPLVETREHVLLRDGTPPLAVDWEGVPIIGGRTGGTEGER